MLSWVEHEKSFITSGSDLILEEEASRKSQKLSPLEIKTWQKNTAVYLIIV